MNSLPPTIYQGENSSQTFSGENKTQTTFELYAQSADFFANNIKQKLIPQQEYIFADLGCYGGELQESIINLLPQFQFYTIGIDHENNLLNNNFAHEKIGADIERVPLKDNSVDIALMRYVLHWNIAEKQKRILKETMRLIRDFAIIQHVGPDQSDAVSWREKITVLLSGKVPKIERYGHFWSSSDEVESWMKEQNIQFERIQHRKIDTFSNMFYEKYNLSEEENREVVEFLGDKNYIVQTSWLIYPV